MKKYKLLNQFVYTVEDKSLPKKKIADEEYKLRINGYSTIVTQLRPKLMDEDGASSNSDPIFFVETTKINKLISEIYRNSKLIVSLGQILPGVAKDSFINTLLINEIHFTNEIEGVVTDREEIGTIVGNNKKINRAKRLSSTVNMYIDTVRKKSKKILELKDFRDIYDELLEGEIADQYKPDGKYFRNGFVRIGSESETVHVPPIREEDILVALTNLMDFMNSHDIDPVLKSLVTHFMFENTHPFYDGNGRTGRYLLSSYISSKVDEFTGLSVATAIRQHNSKYYRTFKQAGNMFNRADLTIFLEDMLGIIASGQEDVIQNLIGKKEKLDIINGNLTNNPSFSHLYKSILYLIAQSQLFNTVDSTAIEDREIVAIINKDKIARAKIQNEIKEMTNEGMLIQTSKSPSRHIISKELWRELKN